MEALGCPSAVAADDVDGGSVVSNRPLPIMGGAERSTILNEVDGRGCDSEETENVLVRSVDDCLSDLV